MSAAKIAWTCGHTAGAVCADCHWVLIQRANALQAEADRLREAAGELVDLHAALSARVDAGEPVDDAFDQWDEAMTKIGAVLAVRQ